MSPRQRDQIRRAAGNQPLADPKSAVSKQEQRSTINDKLEIHLTYLDEGPPATKEWFDSWDKAGLTHDFLNTLYTFTQNTVLELKSSGKPRLVVYDTWPSDSRLKKCGHYKDDWVWARLRLSGKVRVIGHLIANKFYVVFLDKDHQFYPSEG